ncbi:hypothetical protein KSP39_PZI023389 [Platanthera zijinensis]|uniref:Uncharacterized protein n=1 Tax=Platanthera zijinensis TaxID=2320716 RepID=A0AAP0ASC9_9ASPA
MVRSVIGSYDVCVIERDKYMDLGFREELRMLMGSKDVRSPVLFMKGRMDGDATEVMQLEEEGKLGLLLEGIPKAVNCEDCGGLRLVMCNVCNGSCKVFIQGEMTLKKCSNCNENGLVSNLSIKFEVLVSNESEARDRGDTGFKGLRLFGSCVLDAI